jgi:3-phosphoshikimate 1-carboxyvinyltransferase
VSRDGDDVTVERHEGDVLHPVTLSMTDCSDLVPAVAVALSAVEGESRISGVGFIRNKESDRLNDLANEMTKCGVSVRADDDGLTVRGCSAVGSAEVLTHHDHRLAMALSLMALSQPSVVVCDADVVSKSWPSYFEDMRGILSTETTEN